MSPEQIQLARHALGLPNRNKRSYRNRFVCEPDSPNGLLWNAMVAAGEARSRPGSQLTGGMTFYWLTLAGARAAIGRGEKLDLEDFPQEAAR